MQPPPAILRLLRDDRLVARLLDGVAIGTNDAALNQRHSERQKAVLGPITFARVAMSSWSRACSLGWFLLAGTSGSKIRPQVYFYNTKVV